MWNVVQVVVAGLVMLIIGYRIYYNYRLEEAIQKYLVASETGKRPIIMLGAFWFTFYEDYDPARLPEHVDFAGMVAVGKKLVMFHEYKWKRVISDY